MTKTILCLMIVITLFALACQRSVHPEAQMSLFNDVEPCATPKNLNDPNKLARLNEVTGQFERFKEAWQTKNDAALNELISDHGLHSTRVAGNLIYDRTSLVSQIRNTWNSSPSVEGLEKIVCGEMATIIFSVKTASGDRQSASSVWVKAPEGWRIVSLNLP